MSGPFAGSRAGTQSPERACSQSAQWFHQLPGCSSANKYQHWINPALPASLAEWQAGAEEHPGSWWTHWADWLHARSGDWVPARDPKKGPLAAIEPAPGSYVKVKS